MKLQSILEADARYSSGLFTPDIALDYGDGALVYDVDGNEYIDCLAGIAVASVGHGNTKLADALYEQAMKLVVSPQNIASEPRNELSELLLAQLPSQLSRVFYTSSGTEAMEAAIKWARMATGRTRFVALTHGFSGRTLGSLPLTWQPKYREPYVPAAFQVEFVDLNDIEALKRAVTDDTAGIVFEPIQGEAGIKPATYEFLQAAREAADAHGALLILDEIQTGVGRTGTFLASQPSGVVPDMVTLAKGLGGGVPIGALVMTAEVAQAMPPGGHGTTFGGNPLVCAAAAAVLREIEDRKLIQNAAVQGERLMQGIRAIDSPHIREVRGKGLLIGIDVGEEFLAEAMQRVRKAGILATSGGPDTIRLLPPLVITEAQVDALVEKLTHALGRA